MNDPLKWHNALNKEHRGNLFQGGQISNPRSINQKHLISAKFAAVKDDLRNDLREYSELLHIPYLPFSNNMDSGFNSKKRRHRSHSIFVEWN